MKKIFGGTASLAVLAALMGPSFTPAQAADLQMAPTYTKAVPYVDDWSPWQIRLQAVDVTSSSNGKSTMYNDHYDPEANPFVNSPASSLAMSDTVIPMINVSYFFTKNLAIEVNAGWPPRSTITGTGGLAGLGVGKASAFAPVVMFQYHFTQLGAFQPYVGVGVNYTSFFNVKAANSPASVPATAGSTVPLQASVTTLSIRDSFGAVGQFGFDYMIDRHWGLNFDVKKIWMRPEYSATADILVPGPAVYQSQGITGTAHIDPWILGGGITYRF